MDSVDKKNIDLVKVKALKRYKGIPWEIRIDMDGNVYIDGEPFSGESSKYPNLSVDVQKQSRQNTGEETQQIIEKGKTVKRGERVTIKDIKGPDRNESTTVKF